MRSLYLDTFSGISGDMLLGLLVDLGIDLSSIERQLAGLPLNGYRLEQRAEQRYAIGGTRVQVICEGSQPSRSWSEIDRMLANGPLDQTTSRVARNIFKRLGVAEAKVHQVDLEDVHFHEVGAVDAIVDIVGSVFGLQQLGVEKILCSPLPLSSGMTQGSHGTLPLPAPATLLLLQGKPVRSDISERELVTPTGAAIVTEMAEFDTLPSMVIERTGYGVGGWQLEDRPNLLRGIIGNSITQDFQGDQVTVIETHLDDSSPEWLGSLIDQLMAKGALDVAFTPLLMKKNRPGTGLTVIAERHDADRLAELILRESSAIGVRMHESRRMKLRREPATVETPCGTAEIKLIYQGDQLLRITPEHSRCVQLAAATERPLPEIYRLVTACANRKYGLEE